MKLRNKRTGEIYSAWSIRVGEEEITSVEQFNNTFEDYKPKEPPIKDKTTRGAIKAWADANLILGNEKVEVSTPTVDCTILTLTYGMTSIDIMINEEITLKNHGRYTIDELCGDSKEEE